jgi:thiol-disulfide isomerase/thioredoxin
MMTKARGLILGGLILCFAVAAFLLAGEGGQGVRALDSRHDSYIHFAKNFHSVDIVNPPQILPDAEIEGADGVFTSLKNIDSGKVRLINVWATWCPPCIKELPLLAKFQAQHPDIKVILLSYDLQKPHEELAAFVAKHGAGNLTLVSDSKLHLRRMMPFPALPATLIVNENNEILYKIQGEGDWVSPSVIEFFKAFMASSDYGRHTR